MVLGWGHPGVCDLNGWEKVSLYSRYQTTKLCHVGICMPIRRPNSDRNLTKRQIQQLGRQNDDQPQTTAAVLSLDLASIVSALTDGSAVFSAADSGSIDAFGRWRVSNPETLFDSKQLHNSAPLFWDDQETSGSGTGSSHSTDEAATTISVGATTAGTRVRQTFQRFNYQPGKSQLVFATCSEFDTATGITKRFGLFDGNDGLFAESEAGTINLVRRTSVSGSPVDNEVAQSSWNLDTMDGNGASGVTLDFSKSQILIIDFEWLGVGRVRMGWVIDGLPIYCHEFLNANSLTTVYMATPNLPLRYEISNDGTGAADDFAHICSTVISEGGEQATGPLRYASNDTTAINANSAGTIYVLVGMRLKSTHLDTTVVQVGVSTLATSTNDNYEWLLILNPTVANAITFSDQTNSGVQTGPGNAGNPSNSTVTGGTILAGGYTTSGSGLQAITDNAIRIGSAIDGTPDELYLCVRPITSNIDVVGGITWRELS
jgi:hypothetical protein